MSTNSKTIRFHINSRTINGSFALTFDSFITSSIEDEIDNFICQHTNKNSDVLVQKVNGIYEINVKGFIAICNRIFNVLKKCS